MDSLTTLLKNLELRFSFIGITETWLRDSLHHTDISGYNFVHNPRKDRTGGGVGLYLADNFDFKCRPDLVFSCTECAESLLFNTTLLRFIFGGANFSSAKCYIFVPGYLTLCLSLSASVSYILHSCKGYLPGTKGYVIYSPGTALRAMYKKTVPFQIFNSNATKIAFS